MKTKFKWIIFPILILVLVQCKKTEATETAATADSATEIAMSDSSAAFIDSAVAAVDSVAVTAVDATKDAAAAKGSAENDNNFPGDYSSTSEDYSTNDASDPSRVRLR